MIYIQVPTAVVLCGRSSVSALGLAAARHLASHGVKTQVFLLDVTHPPQVMIKIKVTVFPLC